VNGKIINYMELEKVYRLMAIKERGGLITEKGWNGFKNE